MEKRTVKGSEGQGIPSEMWPRGPVGLGFTHWLQHGAYASNIKGTDVLKTKWEGISLFEVLSVMPHWPGFGQILNH